jgi:hypothetical protein
MALEEKVGGKRSNSVRLSMGLALLLGLCACATEPPDPALLDNLSEMQIRMRLLQTDLADMRRTLAENEAQRERTSSQDNSTDVLQARLDDLQTRLTALPATIAELCPERPDSALVTTQCATTPNVERVIVSGDKLVVGEEERVWLTPPGVLLTARIDPVLETSVLRATEVVEFERDGNKWVRFQVPVAEEPVTVERRLRRYVRVAGNGRRPAVDMRVQLGDVRQSVEMALTDPSGTEAPVTLGRNFLTDVALLDVARRFIQPAFSKPQN